MVAQAVLVIIVSYLLGSINFAVIFAKAFLNKDVRKLGSGNAGTTNVMRTAGFLPGALTFICDVLKGFVSCYLGSYVFSSMSQNASLWWHEPVIGAYICGVACMLGHVFPMFFQFKGGKGVATSVGIYAVCNPKALIISLAAFAVIVLITRYVSLGSVIAAVTVIISSIALRNTAALLLPQAILSTCMGAIIILKHMDNIKRLVKGTESKIKIRRN